jgi:arginase
VSTLYLLYPEWQAAGAHPELQHGALTIARELFPDTHFLIVDSPDDEALVRTDEVVGLATIAPRFAETIARVRTAAPDAILTIGGTCGVEAAPIAYLNERYDGGLAVVWFDAHGDLNTPRTSPSGHFHGMVLRTLLGDGPDAFVRQLPRPLLARQVFLAGTRDLDPPERDFVVAAGLSVTLPGGLAEPGRLAEEIRAAGFRHVYIHIDLDAIDPSSFRHSLIPTPGGPSLDDVRRAIATLAQECTVVGASVVEYVHGDDASLRAIGDLLASTGLSDRSR